MKMSISFYLLLFLICIFSFQPCHSKSLHLPDHNNFQRKLQAPIKDRLAKIVVSWDKQAIECMKLSASNAGEEREISVESKRQKYKKRRKQEVKRSVEELKKVSWRVDDDHHNHKKVKGNNGFFSSDYEHPRTHPPSHN